MTATRLAVVALMLSACGEKASPGRDDAAMQQQGDALNEPIDTRLTGALYGTPFTLKYAALKRGTSSDPRNWLCVADIPVTYTVCEQQGGPDRTMFLGPYLYDQNGAPQWVVAQVWLYRVNTSFSKPADSGALDIVVDDAASGALKLTMDVSFGETPRTIGSVVVAQ
jgi:hypothetical protein